MKILHIKRLKWCTTFTVKYTNWNNNQEPINGYNNKYFCCWLIFHKIQKNIKFHHKPEQEWSIFFFWCLGESIFKWLFCLFQSKFPISKIYWIKKKSFINNVIPLWKWHFINNNNNTKQFYKSFFCVLKEKFVFGILNFCPSQAIISTSKHILIKNEKVTKREEKKIWNQKLHNNFSSGNNKKKWRRQRKIKRCANTLKVKIRRKNIRWVLWLYKTMMKI